MKMTELKNFKYMKPYSLDVNFDDEIFLEEAENKSFLFDDWTNSGINKTTICQYIQGGYLEDKGESWKLNYPDLTSNQITDYYEIRLKNPKEGQGKYIKPKGQHSRLFRPINLDPKIIFDKTPIIITEGSKKAIKAVQEGFNCLSLSGVYNWKQKPQKSDTQDNEWLDYFSDIIPDFKNGIFEKRIIILAYDADMWHNPNVKQALYQFAAYLISEKNAVVKILTLPNGDAKGVDDFLVKYGKNKFQELVDNAQEVSLKDIQNKLTNKNKLINFPLSIFPEKIQNLILRNHEKYDAPIEYIACVYLSVISIIICGHYSINIKPDSNWIEYPILWLALIGNPSQKKTPCLNFGKNILDKYDIYLESLYSRNYQEYVYAEEVYKRKMEDRKKQAKEKNSIDDMPQKPTPVYKARLTTQNITIESLCDIMKANSSYHFGVNLYLDELTFLLNSFNQYKRNGNDRQYWLQSWSRQRQNIVRKSSKIDYTVDVGHNIIGGIQPKVLYKTLLKDGVESIDGMVERWLYCCSDYQEKGFSYLAQDSIDTDEINEFQNLCDSIFYDISKNLPDDDAEVTNNVCSLSNEATKIFIDYCNQIVNKKKADNVNDLVKSYLQKQTNYVARFSLIIQMFYDFKTDVISDDIIMKAIELSKYFISCFINIINEKIDANPLEDLAISYLKTKEIKFISPTKLLKTNESKYKSLDRAKHVLENLAQKGYGRIIKASNGVKFVFYGC